MKPQLTKITSDKKGVKPLTFNSNDAKADILKGIVFMMTEHPEILNQLSDLYSIISNHTLEEIPSLTDIDLHIDDSATGVSTTNTTLNIWLFTHDVLIDIVTAFDLENDLNQLKTEFLKYIKDNNIQPVSPKDFKTEDEYFDAEDDYIKNHINNFLQSYPDIYFLTAVDYLYLDVWRKKYPLVTKSYPFKDQS